MRSARGRDSVVRAVLLASAVPACVVIVGVVLQLVALPQPGASRLHAVQTLRSVLGYQFVRSVERIGGGFPVEATCWQSWFRTRGGKSRRGGFVLLSDGRRILNLHGDLRLLAGRREDKTRLFAAYELAGCADSIVERLGYRLQEWRPIGAGRAWADGTPAYAFRLGAGREQFRLIVSRRSYAPLILEVRVGRISGWSDLEPARLRPAFASRLRALLRQAEARHA